MEETHAGAPAHPAHSALADPEHPVDHHALHTHFDAAPPATSTAKPGFHPDQLNALNNHDGGTTITTPTTNATHSNRSSGAGDEHKEPPCCPPKMIIFTVNLLLGLLLSQLLPEWLASNPEGLTAYKQVVKICTMFCLAFIMIHVGLEFDIDKSRLRSYGKDYAVGMTAAGLPWIAVAAWFIWVLPNPLDWKEALVAARFAAPTSAGILFAMLEAAGLKQTWLFRKARILAIFDDLDTILLMVPLKVIVVGMKWELSIDLGLVVVCFILIWVLLHKVRAPYSWNWVMLYAAVVAAVSEIVHFCTADPNVDSADLIETVHLEVLLPAFTIGCIILHDHHPKPKPERPAPTHLNPHPTTQLSPSRVGTLAEAPAPLKLPSSSTPSGKPKRPRLLSHRTHRRAGVGSLGLCTSGFVEDIVSCVFMLFVGLSMPSLTGDPSAGAHRMLSAISNMSAVGSGSGSGSSAVAYEPMGAGALALHVAAVSLLMIIGKMFPLCVYRDEVPFATRLALSLGMCPRGEVGAGVIVISLTFGISGDAITIAVICLALNLVASSLFIMAVKKLARLHPDPPEGGKAPAPAPLVVGAPVATALSSTVGPVVSTV